MTSDSGPRHQPFRQVVPRPTHVASCAVSKNQYQVTASPKTGSRSSGRFRRSPRPLWTRGVHDWLARRPANQMHPPRLRVERAGRTGRDSRISFAISRATASGRNARSVRRPRTMAANAVPPPCRPGSCAVAANSEQCGAFIEASSDRRRGHAGLDSPPSNACMQVLGSGPELNRDWP